MKTVAMAAVIAAVALGTAGAARAEDRVCVWTGLDWACGNGKTFTQHFSRERGPNIAVVPQRTTVMPAREPTFYSPPGAR
ncbi:MAG TPA: hypothetical protein VMI30_03310 [Stellaceae bacterium]|nr:hypothetical protein [Stellaceae bacterium]